jgi:hypothetical protein
MLVYNGDWGDYMALGTHPKGSSPNIVGWREEISQQRECLKAAQEAIKPKKAKWNDGNHEWRMQRAFERDPKLAMTVLDLSFEKQAISSVREAVSIPVIFNFKKYGIEYSGTSIPRVLAELGDRPEKNVYVHHGYTANAKGGYTVSGQMDRALDFTSHRTLRKISWAGVEQEIRPRLLRHREREPFHYRRAGLWDEIYAGVPHSDPKLMNHRQGISIIYYDNGHWWPFCIKIREGKAVFNGKLYRS